MWKLRCASIGERCDVPRMRCVAGSLSRAGRRVGGLGGDPAGLDLAITGVTSRSGSPHRFLHNDAGPARIASTVGYLVALPIPIPTGPPAALDEPDR